MAYYIRIFGSQNSAIEIDALSDFLTERNCPAGIKEEEGPETGWTSLFVRDSKNREIVIIERDIVVQDGFAKEEIEEFREELENAKPLSAARWINEFFRSVKIIYALQILSSVDNEESWSDNEESWSIVGALKEFIWRETQGIIQADGEGFTNQEGYHILWQFAEDVTGEWSMAVLDSSGNWINFLMDLEDRQQRKEFWNGEVPKSARLIKE